MSPENSTPHQLESIQGGFHMQNPILRGLGDGASLGHLVFLKARLRLNFPQDLKGEV